MDDVAKKIGVSKKALYLCFASKIELFEETVRQTRLAFKEILYSSFKDPATVPNMLESASQFFGTMVLREK